MLVELYNINPTSKGKTDSFEELSCQLFYREFNNLDSRYYRYRGDGGDGGVEALFISKNTNKKAVQSKFWEGNNFSTTQIKQLDSSINAAMNNHPTIKEYYIFIPFNLTGKVKNRRGKSQTEKFEEWKVKYEKLYSIDIILYQETLILDLLIKHDNDGGLKLYWFNKQKFDKKLWAKHSDETIKRLKERYIPKLHQELEIEKKLSFLYEGDKSILINIDNLLKKFEKEIYDLSGKFHNIQLYRNILSVSNFNKVFEDLMIKSGKKLFDKIPRDENFFYKSLNNFFTYIDDLYDSWRAFQKKIKSEIEKDTHLSKYIKDDINKEIGTVINKLLSLIEIKYDAESLYGEKYFNWLDNSKSVLMIQGEGGIGKSHLLADITSKAIYNDICVFMFLGSDFKRNINPWEIILSRLRIDIKSLNRDGFLGALNSHGELMQTKSVIVIDALDEGDGGIPWRDYLESFVKDINDYPYVGLVLSFRSSYRRVFYEKNKQIWFKKISHITHHGFKFERNNFEIVKNFFRYYKLDFPNFPFLDPDFYNPLFLITLCKTLKLKKMTSIPDQYNFIFVGYIDAIFDKICEQYSVDKNTLKSVLLLIGEKISSSELGYSTIDELSVLLKNENLGYQPSTYLDIINAFISEGLLMRDYFENYNSDVSTLSDSVGIEGLKFTYGRLQAFIIASVYYRKLNNYWKPQNILKKIFRIIFIKESKYVLSMIQDIMKNGNQEILESLFVLYSISNNKSLITKIKIKLSDVKIINAFLKSLVWSNSDSIDMESIHFFNRCLNNENANGSALSVLYHCHNRVNHPLNCSFLHDWLSSLTVEERDSRWSNWIGLTEYWNNDSYNYTQRINKHYNYADFNFNSSLTVLIEWIRENKTGSIHSAIYLTWLLSTSHRPIRDQATKAIVTILINKPLIADNLLSMFIEVNDTSILERLLLSILGALLISSVDSDWKSCILRIYNKVFTNEEVFPHLLIRHYARRIIETGLYNSLILSEPEIEDAIIPPYISEWISPCKKTKELQSIFNIPNSGKKLIMSSVLPEKLVWDGKDFWAYSYDEAHFEHEKLSKETQGRIILEKIIEQGYNEKTQGKYDLVADNGTRRMESGPERLGKKYIWQFLYEIEARAIDNGKWTSYYNEDYDNPHIDSFRIDLDPTMNIFIEQNETINKSWYFPKININWKESISKRIEETALNDVRSIIIQEDDKGKTELLLYDARSFYSPHDDSSTNGFVDFWIKSFIVSKDSIEEAIKDIKDKYFERNNVRRPEWLQPQLSNEASHSYYYEYYNLKNNNSYLTTCGEEIITSFSDGKGDDPFSKKELNCLIPTNYFYELMEFELHNTPGIFTNKSGDIIFYNVDEQSAVINAQELSNKLEENDLTIIWFSFAWSVDKTSKLFRKIHTIAEDTDMEIIELYSDCIDQQ